MTKLKILLVLLFLVFLLPAAHPQSRDHRYLLIGGYTKLSEQNGIAVYDFNLKTGTLQFKSVTGGIENPSYLAISKSGKNIYSVSEKNGGAGNILAFRFDRLSGKLSFVNKASSGGEGPCYVSVDDAGSHVFAANYGSGSLAAIGLAKDGSLDPAAVQTLQHTGSSINKESQTGPHAHSVVLSPDNHFLLSADLGTDRIYIYRYDPSAASSLIPAPIPFVNTKPGAGPRHICFHPNGNYVYVVNELDGSVDVFGYSGGILTPIQSISLLPANFTGIIEAADIHISPDGKFLYASNRETRNELIIYSINRQGRLALTGHQPVLGAVPRNFVMDPSGKFLLVANQKSNEVIVFRRDLKTGLLKYTGKKIPINKPSCLKFAGDGR